MNAVNANVLDPCPHFLGDKFGAIVGPYVFRRPSQDEQISIENSIDDALRVLPLLAEGSWEKAVHRLHTK